MATKFPRHFFDRQFAFDKVGEAALIGQIQQRIVETCQNHQGEAIEIIGMSHFELECTFWVAKIA